MQKTALVLAGGGSRGAYQIGVWQALIELDVKIDIVTGTSVGALNAAMITMNDYENALNLWKSIKTSMVLDIDLDEELPTEKKIRTVVRKFLADYVKQGGTDAHPLKQLLDKYAIEETIRKSPIECGIIVIDKTSLKPLELFKEDIKEGQLSDYLLASSSLFPAIKCCNIDGIDYMDGGYYDNLPVELALKKGADRIIAVDLEAIGMVRRHTFEKATDLTIIKSYWNLGPILVFDNKIISKNIRLGYLDTMKAFKVYDGIAYTFVKNEIASFISREKQLIKTFHRAYGLTYSSELHDKKEELFHLKISSHLKRKYGRELDNHYSTFLKASMETAGELLELDCTKIYTVESFNQRLIEKANELEVPYIDSKELATKAKIKQALSMLDKKVRTIYLAASIKRAVSDGMKIDSLGLALFLPDELLAAYYLAMLD